MLFSMSGLTQSSCVPCRGGVPQLTDAEIAPLAAEIPEWTLLELDGVRSIERAYRFKDFRDAMRFAVAVGELAEREQHHPDLHVAWGRVRVQTWTHKIRGLHRNDFVLAAKVDALYGGGSTA
jgi:4a-hydroxytetrahydrobiopterin dehydratase